MLGGVKSRYEFEPVPLTFLEGRVTNVFAKKNNKTLQETFEHRRYLKLGLEMRKRYDAQLSQPLGDFLLKLKSSGDMTYRKFLNAYGDEIYTTFRIQNTEHLMSRGVYAYCVDSRVVYVGRCRDNMGSRINQGYGKIHPKNCYLDGQATNCHLNALVASTEGKIELWLSRIDDADTITAVERDIIQSNKPVWNLHHYV